VTWNWRNTNNFILLSLSFYKVACKKKLLARNLLSEIITKPMGFQIHDTDIETELSLNVMFWETHYKIA
jgi:hypothetical protein